MYKYQCELIRVIDGDSLEANVDLGFDVFKKVSIRLYGIDTPEIRTRDINEKVWGIAATERVKELLKANGNSFVIISRDYDKFGRSLAEIYLMTEDRTLNQILLDEDLAKEYYGGKRK